MAAGRYLNARDLEIGTFYKIEIPFTAYNFDRQGLRTAAPPRRGVHKYIGKLARGAPNFLFEVASPPGVGVLAYPGTVSVAPINMDDPNDIAMRVSPSARVSAESQLLARLPDDASSKVRGFMARGFLGGKKSRKTRRKGKKTLRRK